MYIEYEDTVRDIFLSRLFALYHLREATIGTDWTVEDVWQNSENSVHQILVLLLKLIGSIIEPRWFNIQTI